MFRHLSRPIRGLPSPCITSVRTLCTTVLGESRRRYVRGELLHENAFGDNKVFKASSGNESFILKQESDSRALISQRLAYEFAGSRRLRLPIDVCPDDEMLVYPYYTDDMFNLIENNPDLPVDEIVKILRHVGESIQELHAKGWLHRDIKPNNIFVNWTSDEQGKKTITNAVLGDYDIAVKLKGDTPVRSPYPLGNVMWRSPEQQCGSGITKASDIFSYGLVCLYALGGGDLLLLHDKELRTKLANIGVSAKREILTRHFTYFGPSLSEALLSRVDSDQQYHLHEASEVAKMAVKEQPELHFDVWGNNLGDDAHAMIAGMTNPDPTARSTIDQVLASSWWEKDGGAIAGGSPDISLASFLAFTLIPRARAKQMKV
ncbi:hypothetical protein PG990_013594 [Apiospora arundinis]